MKERELSIIYSSIHECGFVCWFTFVKSISHFADTIRIAWARNFSFTSEKQRRTLIILFPHHNSINKIFYWISDEYKNGFVSIIQIKLEEEEKYGKKRTGSANWIIAIVSLSFTPYQSRSRASIHFQTHSISYCFSWLLLFFRKQLCTAYNLINWFICFNLQFIMEIDYSIQHS